MKVLHVIDSGGMYGAENVLLNLVREQVKLGLRPWIASIGEKGINEKPLEREARSRGFSVAQFRMRPGPNPRGALLLRNYALRNGFDILHSHGYKGNILLGFMPSGFRGLPVLSTLHGYTSTGGMTKMRAYEWLDRIVLPRLDAVVLVSEAMRENPKLRRLRGADFRVIPNGIPPLEEVGGLENDRALPLVSGFCESGFIIGAVGRLSREKGFHHLIDAFGMVASDSEDCKLLILGEGGERDRLEEKVRSLGLQDRALLPGYVKNAAYYMKFFDLFVLSSITEGLPMTLLEAMQQGVPPVCTRVGGMVNVLRHGQNGLLVEHSDPAALAEAIRLIHRDIRLRDALGSEAAREVREKYSSERMALEYRDLYRWIAGQRSRTASRS
jgi:glycosyltransferase involved in cell wall biosynthesis